MLDWWILGGIGGAIGLLYITWGFFERRRSRRGKSIAADLAALGDEVVPPSLHPVIDPDVCIGSGACARACPEGEILEVIHGRAQLVNPLACIGHGACAAACPVGAIKLVFGTAQRGLELPAIDPDFQTNLPGIYIIGELGGMGLIRNAVEQGRQAALHAARRRRRGSDVDALVVGAGPAGISAALQLNAAGLRTLIVEQGEYGGTIRHYPRAKVVMTGNLDLAGYGTIRRRTMSKEQLLELWDDVRDRAGLQIQTGVKIDRVAAHGGEWEVAGGQFTARAGSVLLALGRRGSPRTLGVPGEDLAKVHYRLLEPEPFERQHVLVVGGGNAAADCALALAQFRRCASVTLSYRRRQMARLRGSVRQALDAAFADQSVIPALGTEVEAITPDEVILRDDHGHRQRIPNHAVIVQIGGTAPTELLRSIGVELVTKRGEA
jgi:thioredoxin reductase/NAD-dependent dihydropyrimidine dehydrogenase PreA subunit